MSMKSHCKRPVLRGLLGCLAAVAGLTGCQATYNNQTLPSPYYLSNNIQYYPPGPWFKLQHEADNMKLYNEQAAQQQGPQGPPAPLTQPQ
jgi:hypothetical protein